MSLATEDLSLFPPLFIRMLLGDFVNKHPVFLDSSINEDRKRHIYNHKPASHKKPLKNNTRALKAESAPRPIIEKFNPDPRRREYSL
jgi:hypothetical protein